MKHLFISVWFIAFLFLSAISAQETSNHYTATVITQKSSIEDIHQINEHALQTSNLHVSLLTQDDKSLPSMFNMKRNAIYNEDILGFSYERLFPVQAKFAWSLKAGILIFDPFLWMIDAGFVTGGPKHYFETTIGGLIEPDFKNDAFLTLRSGYRYQAKSGFIFKFGPIYSPPDNFILPMLCFGYGF